MLGPSLVAVFGEGVAIAGGSGFVPLEDGAWGLVGTAFPSESFLCPSAGFLALPGLLETMGDGFAEDCAGALLGGVFSERTSSNNELSFAKSALPARSKTTGTNRSIIAVFIKTPVNLHPWASFKVIG